MGLMDMFGKSKLVDCNSYLSHTPGSLSTSPVPQIQPDGNVSVWFNPDNKSYLVNRNKTQNKNSLMELKVNVADKNKQPFLEAVKAMMGQKIFVSGALINDDSKEGKTEVRPLDLIWCSLPEAQNPVWTQEIRKNLPDPAAMVVYKVAAASDASTSGVPPKAGEPRTLQINFPYPAQPNIRMPKLNYDVRPTVSLNAGFEMNEDLMKHKIDFLLPLKSLKKDGPTVFVADIVMFWRSDIK